MLSVGHETGPASGGMVGQSSHGEQPPTPGGYHDRPGTDNEVCMNPRATNAPCPCGSGLVGLRNITTFTGQFVACRKCRMPAVKATPYRESNDADAKRQAAARRRLEEMRDGCE